MGNLPLDPGRTYVLEETTITQSLSLDQLGLLATKDTDFIEVDFDAALEPKLEAPKNEPQTDASRTMAYIASKLGSALLRAHCALSPYEGLHAAHKEHLQWIGEFDRLPAPLGPSLDSLILDLKARFQVVQRGGPRVSVEEAQVFIKRIEEVLDMTLIAINANHRRSLT